MFSYRHVFHAGNHADVVKHMVLVQLLQYACQKETACFYIDTHAGEGVYRLQSHDALKNAEFQTGIDRLWKQKDLPPALHVYRQLVRDMNPDGNLKIYPGSPFIANRLLRGHDRLRLFELHTGDIRRLEMNFQKMKERVKDRGEKAAAESKRRGKRVMIAKEDGFSRLKSLLPPPSRRAVCLIDPSYEDKKDYRRVIETLDDALKRFATGTYAVWFPVVQRPEARKFPEQLKRLPAEWLYVNLSVSRPLPGRPGLTGSGMFIINPPWTLEKVLHETMPYLVKTLGQDAAAMFRIETGAGKKTGTGKIRE